MNFCPQQYKIKLKAEYRKMIKNIDSSLGENDKLGWLERTTKLIAKYGIFRVVGAIIVIALFGMVLGLFIYQKPIMVKMLEEQRTVQAKEHTASMQLRLNHINPQIDAILLKLLIDTGSDRVFVVEMHNGSNNPTGLPFVYGEVTYEQVVDSNIALIAEEYGVFNLSRFTFVNYIHKNKLFKGDNADLNKIDHKLATRMGQNDVKYSYMVSLTGSNVSIGFLGVSYINKDVKKSMDGKIIDASQKISILLDLYNKSVESQQQ